MMDKPKNDKDLGGIRHQTHMFLAKTEALAAYQSKRQCPSSTIEGMNL